MMSPKPATQILPLVDIPVFWSLPREGLNGLAISMTTRNILLFTDGLGLGLVYGV